MIKKYFALLIFGLYLAIVPALNFMFIERLQAENAEIRAENAKIHAELNEIRELTTPKSMQDRTIKWILGGDE